MRNGKVNDIVTCDRVGSGDYKVIDTREGHVTTELRLQSVSRPMDIRWVDEYFCTKNLRASLAAREMAATKILSKVRHG